MSSTQVVTAYSSTSTTSTLEVSTPELNYLQTVTSSADSDNPTPAKHTYTASSDPTLLPSDSPDATNRVLDATDTADSRTQ